jgi:Co/Zn/Cd efflux system component
MIRRSWLREARSQGQALRRLERAAALMNPFLLVIAIGLLVINLSCYAALELGRMHSLRGGPSQVVNPAPVLGQTAVTGPPLS